MYWPMWYYVALRAAHHRAVYVHPRPLVAMRYLVCVPSCPPRPRGRGPRALSTVQQHTAEAKAGSEVGIPMSCRAVYVLCIPVYIGILKYTMNNKRKTSLLSNFTFSLRGSDLSLSYF